MTVSAPERAPETFPLETFSVETFSLEMAHPATPGGTSLSDAMEAEIRQHLGPGAGTLLRWAIVKADTKKLWCEGAYLKELEGVYLKKCEGAPLKAHAPQ